MFYPKSKKKEEYLSIVFQPFVQITHQDRLVIRQIVTEQITYEPIKEDVVASNKLSSTTEKQDPPQTSGLDCSGQGQCQPNPDISETNQMQNFLVNANRKATARAKQKRKKKAETSAHK